MHQRFRESNPGQSGGKRALPPSLFQSWLMLSSDSLCCKVFLKILQGILRGHALTESKKQTNKKKPLWLNFHSYKSWTVRLIGYKKSIRFLMWRIKCVQYVGKLWISAKALGKNWHRVGNHKGMPRFQHPSIFKNYNYQSWRHFQRYYLALIPRMICKYRLLPAGPQIRIGTKRKKHTKCSNVRQQLKWSSEHVSSFRLQKYPGDSTELCLVCCKHLSLINPWGNLANKNCRLLAPLTQYRKWLNTKEHRNILERTLPPLFLFALLFIAILFWSGKLNF